MTASARKSCCLHSFLSHVLLSSPPTSLFDFSLLVSVPSLDFFFSLLWHLTNTHTCTHTHTNTHTRKASFKVGCETTTIAFLRPVQQKSAHHQFDLNTFWRHPSQETYDKVRTCMNKIKHIIITQRYYKDNHFFDIT